MSDCIFCKIAAGEIPSSTIYEDEDFRVILDLGPATKGHALILPKKHFRNIFEMDDETAAKVFVLAKYENDGQHILWQPNQSSPEELSVIAKQISSFFVE